MQGNRSTDTRPEAALRSAIHRLGLRFRKHHRPLPSLRCRPDLVFPRERVAVFSDGCYWHRCPDHGVRPQTNRAYWDEKIERNVQRDRRNNDELAAAGWMVVRVWEHEDVALAARRVAEVVSSRREALTQTR
jgi:DNA mismatch endonuclease, patch repair protein